MHYAGDAVLSKFDAALDALSCATDVQTRLRTCNAELPADQRVEFRIGVNLGDVIEDHGDIYGEGVNVAARLESLADPGGVCISESKVAVGAKLACEYEPMGEQRVKNIADPVRAYRVLLTNTDGAPLPQAKPAIKLPDGPSLAILPFTCLFSLACGHPCRELQGDWSARQRDGCSERSSAFEAG